MIRMAKRQKKNDERKWMILALLLIGGYFYVYQMPWLQGIWGGITLPGAVIPQNPSIPQTSCSQYNLAYEFEHWQGAANMQAAHAGCIAGGGVWTEQSNEVSCHGTSTQTVDCTLPAIAQMKTFCEGLHATFYCSNSVKYLGCYCNKNAPTEPLGGFAPDQGGEPIACGWHNATVYSLGTCGGSCPAEQSCQTSGTTCACFNMQYPEPPTQERNIFLSSLTWNGAMGALAGADAKCANMAYYAGKSGTWIALMSAPYADIKYRLMDKAYYRMDGTLVASSTADLFDGTIAAPINIDENGVVHSGDDFAVWTGSTAEGTNTGTNCHNWGWVSATGTVGDPTATAGNWLNAAAGDCAQNKRIYCVRYN